MSIHVDEIFSSEDLPEAFPHQTVVVKKTGDLRTVYDIGTEIGRGKFGIVFRCSDRATGQKLAVKFVATPKRDDKRDVEREVDIMNSLHHPSIIQIYDAFDANKEMALIMELVEGGELFDRVIEDDYVLTERACAVIISQIFTGVKYIHQNRILHLDLKPENVICTSKAGNQIKIIDFGLARRYDPSKKLQVLFGTPEFVAPEVVNFDAVGYPTDIWSIGVITYVLVSGLSPFMGDSDCETMANVTIANYDFDDEAFDDVSPACQDFISKILIKDKSKRLSADEALSHEWLRWVQLPVSSGASRSRQPSLLSAEDLTALDVRKRSEELVSRWLSHPESPYDLADSECELAFSRVGSLLSVGGCSPSDCASISVFSDSSSSISSTDSAVVNGALLRPTEPEKKKLNPLDRVRAASLRREESLKRIRGRLTKQARKEERYISIEEVRILKQRGSLADALLKVTAIDQDARRGSMSAIEGRLSCLEVSNKLPGLSSLTKSVAIPGNMALSASNEPDRPSSMALSTGDSQTGIGARNARANILCGGITGTVPILNVEGSPIEHRSPEYGKDQLLSPASLMPEETAVVKINNSSKNSSLNASRHNTKTSIGKDSEGCVAKVSSCVGGLRSSPESKAEAPSKNPLDERTFPKLKSIKPNKTLVKSNDVDFRNISLKPVLKTKGSIDRNANRAFTHLKNAFTRTSPAAEAKRQSTATSESENPARRTRSSSKKRTSKTSDKQKVPQTTNTEQSPSKNGQGPRQMAAQSDELVCAGQNQQETIQHVHSSRSSHSVSRSVLDRSGNNQIDSTRAPSLVDFISARLETAARWQEEEADLVLREFTQSPVATVRCGK